MCCIARCLFAVKQRHTGAEAFSAGNAKSYKLSLWPSVVETAASAGSNLDARGGGGSIGDGGGGGGSGASSSSSSTLLTGMLSVRARSRNVALGGCGELDACGGAG